MMHRKNITAFFKKLRSYDLNHIYIAWDFFVWIKKKKLNKML